MPAASLVKIGSIEHICFGCFYLPPPTQAMHTRRITMNAMQRKHLRDRIEALIRQRQYRLRSQVREFPAAIQALIEKRKVIDEKLDEWENQCAQEEERERQKIRDLENFLMAEVLFRDPDSALARIEELEAQDRNSPDPPPPSRRMRRRR
jgi:hypothetical protein